MSFNDLGRPAQGVQNSASDETLLFTHPPTYDDSSHISHGSSGNEPAEEQGRLIWNRMEVKEGLSSLHTEDVNGVLQNRRVDTIMGESLNQSHVAQVLVRLFKVFEKLPVCP